MLAELAVEPFARGLSIRKIEAPFAWESGRGLLSRMAASEITKQLAAEYEAVEGRDPAILDVLYPFVGSIAKRLYPGQRHEAMLAAWDILSDAKKVLLRLAPGRQQDTSSWEELLQEMCPRLPNPLLAVSALGSPAVRRLEDAQPAENGAGRSLAGVQGRGRRLPSGLAGARTCCVTSSLSAPSRRARRSACRMRLTSPISACRSLTDRSIGITNLLDRMFGEGQQRDKVRPHVLALRTVLKLTSAGHICAAARCRGLETTEFEHGQPQKIRDELNCDRAEHTKTGAGIALTACQS